MVCILPTPGGTAELNKPKMLGNHHGNPDNIIGLVIKRKYLIKKMLNGRKKNANSQNIFNREFIVNPSTKHFFRKEFNITCL